MKLTLSDIRNKIKNGETVDVECKAAESSIPGSVYESYSAFANTSGGMIFLGINENKKERNLSKRFSVEGLQNADKQINDFWNTINGNKVNVNILKDEDVYKVEEDGKTVIVINVPRADYKIKPVYIGENPFKGTFKRNHEGDYHATEYEVKAMIRDQNTEGNDGMVLEHYDMNDIDTDTLRVYRQLFSTVNPDHVWNSLNNKDFLQMLGGYRIDRKNKVEGLTLAGLLMFGQGLPIRDEFDNILMDYRDESKTTEEVRWNDRITYDGTWENNLFNFFMKVTRKLTEDLPKPFKLEGNQRIDDSPVHKAVREAFVNLIIHSDYLMDAGVLKVIKLKNGFSFTNPGVLKIPREEIYKGGNSKARNPKMQTMLRMVGFGDNAGSGFPAILKTWADNNWIVPELMEDTVLNHVVLTLSLEKQAIKTSDKKQAIKTSDKKQAIKTQDHVSQIIKYLKENGESKTVDIAEAIQLSPARTRAVMAEIKEVISLGNNRNRTYKLKE